MTFILRILLCSGLFLVSSLSLRAQEPEYQGYVRLADPATSYTPEDVRITPPRVLMQGTPGEFALELLNTDKPHGEVDIFVDGELQTVALENGRGTFVYTPPKGAKEVAVEIEGFRLETPINPVPLWMSILPPLLAIVLALVFREVIISIFLGLLLGAGIMGFYAGGSMQSAATGLLDVISVYLAQALGDPDHAKVILFTLLIGALVAIVSRNGGMQGVVNILSRMARNAKSSQFATWLMGIAIFFDDYANSLVVGHTMRPITDRFLVSREKLSYIVDSTAAPVAALAFITTWIGVELEYIQTGTENLVGFPEESAYSIFLNSLAYSFYPILALIFILFIIFTGRDFGPMRTAERRARMTGQVSRDRNPNDDGAIGGEDFSPVEKVRRNPRAFNAILPLLLLIFGVAAGLYYTGSQAVEPGDGLTTGSRLSQIIGNANTYNALLWASLSAVILAVVLTLVQGIMGVGRLMESLTTGFKAMLPALVILVLAWGLAQITRDMGTAVYLAGLLGDDPSPTFAIWMPALIFVTSAAVAFATGSSWGTMAILYPIMLGVSWKLFLDTGLSPEASLPLFYNSVSAVLAGAVLGDHCSPISDTTILSSLATDCNHIDHVRTQLPYALTVGLVATLAGTVPAAYGLAWYITFPAAILILWIIVKTVGRPLTPSEA